MTARKEAGLLTMDDYFRQRQSTFSKYIATRSLIYLCEGSERSLGGRVGMRWWEQAGINLEWAREATAAVFERDGGEE